MKQRKAPSSRGQRICRCFSENVMVLKAGAGQQVGELLFPLFRWVPPTARRCCISVCNHRVCWAGKSNRSEKQGGESGGTPAQAATVKYLGVYRVFSFEESFPHLSRPSLLELYWWMGCSWGLRPCRTTAEVSWGRDFFRFWLNLY